MASVIAPIAVSDLTTGTVGGTGVFDVLMQAAKAHIDVEWKLQRIKGPEYSTVYLGAMTAVMQQAIAFLNAQKQSELLQSQVDLTEAQVELAKKQLDKITAEIALAEKQLALLEKQLLKQEAEIELIEQRVITEKAQTQDFIPELENVTDVDGSVLGIVGKKKLLHTAQEQGFYRDREQKIAKMMIDTWNVRRTTDEEGTDVGSNGLNDYEINRVLNKAKEGMDLAPYGKYAQANFTWVVQGTDVLFSDMSTVYADDPIKTWAWEFGDAGNSTGTGKQVSFTYPSDDLYEVTLLITTDSGQTSAVVNDVRIGPEPEPDP